MYKRQVTDKPSLLMCKTVIGFGSPNKAGTHDVVSYTHLDVYKRQVQDRYRLRFAEQGRHP
ncbi:hypothetical protein [Serratia marcescens]|uniref:hypothetical protein n=1 Tax=Serratia marcescens TaxID=615 RepID=UPI00385761AF